MTPEVTAEEWLRDIAANGNVMSVRLNGRVPRGLSNVGDLYPETIAEVLAELDATRAENARLRTALESDDWSAAVEVLGRAVADDPPDPDSPMVSNEWTYLLLERLHDDGWSFIARAALKGT